MANLCLAVPHQCASKEGSHHFLFSNLCIWGMAELRSLPFLAKSTLYFSVCLRYKSLLGFKGNISFDLGYFMQFVANRSHSIFLLSARTCKFRTVRALLYDIQFSFKITLQATFWTLSISSDSSSVILKVQTQQLNSRVDLTYRVQMRTRSVRLTLKL